MLSRRQVLLGVAAAGALGGCGSCGDRRESARSTAMAPAEAPDGWTELAWTAAEVPPEGQHALVRSAGAEAPVLIALHGRGEAGRGLAAGARGWRASTRSTS